MHYSYWEWLPYCREQVLELHCWHSNKCRQPLLSLLSVLTAKLNSLTCEYTYSALSSCRCLLCSGFYYLLSFIFCSPSEPTLNTSLDLWCDRSLHWTYSRIVMFHTLHCSHQIYGMKKTPPPPNPISPNSNLKYKGRFLEVFSGQPLDLLHKGVGELVRRVLIGPIKLSCLLGFRGASLTTIWHH